MAKTSNISILVVDDEKEIREAVRGLFQAFGFAVETASSGNRAWKMLQESEFSIVVTDIRMPDGTGMELLQKIRERSLKTPRVFMVTGFSDHTPKEIFRNGADGLFNKPFDTRLLMDTIRQALLPNQQRWQPFSSREVVQQISLNSSNSSLEVDDFLFGRGGFCLRWKAPSDATYEEGECVSFEISLPQTGWPALTGTGVFRWVEWRENFGEVRAGIEIIHLSDECRSEVSERVERLHEEADRSLSLPLIPAFND